MVRVTSDTVLDQMLQYIRGNSNTLWLVSDASSTSTFNTLKTDVLASAFISSGMFAIANAPVDGRQLTLNLTADISVTTGGSVTHGAIVHTTASTMLHIAQASTKIVNAGSQLAPFSFRIIIRDPTAP